VPDVQLDTHGGQPGKHVAATVNGNLPDPRVQPCQVIRNLAGDFGIYGMRRTPIRIQHPNCAPDQARKAQKKPLTTARPPTPRITLTLSVEGMTEAGLADLVMEMARSVNVQRRRAAYPYPDLPQPQLD
jgi:hypothetical protein